MTATSGGSTGLPARLARLNPTSAFLGTLVVVLIGLLVPGVIGGLVLLALAGALIALAALTWPIATAGTRVIRVLLLAALVAGALLKIF